MSFSEAALRLYSRIAPTERGGYRLARLVRQSRRRDKWNDIFQTPDAFRIALDLAIYPDCCMAYGMYELDTARLIKRILKPGDHFVDGGANIGYFTLLAATCVGPGGRIDAFEPQPDNLRRLRENLGRNGLESRVNVHPVALAEAAGELEIYSPDPATDNHGTSSIYADPTWGEAASVQRHRVPAMRMDAVLAGSSPALIKLDVEGAEPLAVAGMSGLLKSAAPALLLELNPTKASIAGFAPDEAVRRALEAQPAYELFYVGWRLSRITPRDLPRLRQGNVLLRVPR